ncbi:MAG: PKD domain-containing protein [Thermoplasmata archaeon]|nr:PKD domain-containing protein [Thermoplasmata archaeon]
MAGTPHLSAPRPTDSLGAPATTQLTAAADSLLRGGNPALPSTPPDPVGSHLRGPSAAGPDWWNLTSKLSTFPAKRANFGMTYDAADGYVVLFGGFVRIGTATTFSDTWKFSGGRWTELFPASSPSPRSGPVLVDDLADGYLLLFGGVNATGVVLGDTWKFSAGEWSQLAPASPPPPRIGAQGVYDAADHYVVVFGGDNRTHQLIADTWKYVGGTWTQLTPSTTPAARYFGEIEYDAVDGYVVMFGGENATTFVLGDTWRFAGGEWTQLYPAQNAPARSFAGLAADPTDGYLVLFGGANNTDNLHDTWAFAGGNWNRLHPSVGPSGRGGFGEVWDAADGFILFFSGSNETYGGRYYNDTWAYAAPISALARASPSPADANQMVRFVGNATGGVVPDTFSWTFGDGMSGVTSTPQHAYVTAGTYVVNLTIVDSFAQTSTTSLTVTVHPPVAARATATPSTLDLGQTASFVGSASGGTPPFVYRWSFGDGATSPTANSSHLFASTANFSAMLLVNDSAGANSSATVHVLVNARLSLSIVVTPLTAVPGQSISGTSTTSGGTGPITVHWDLGDGAMSSSSSLVHAYASAGSYLVKATATDQTGATSSGNATVVVASAPASTPGFLGLSGGLGYVVVGVVLLAVAVGVVAIVLRRKPGTRASATVGPPPTMDGAGSSPPVPPPPANP